MMKRTGLSNAELFRRGLRRLADEALSEKKPGFSLRHLVATAASDDLPADVAEHADNYLYGGGYGERSKRKRARTR